MPDTLNMYTQYLMQIFQNYYSHVSKRRVNFGAWVIPQGHTNGNVKIWISWAKVLNLNTIFYFKCMLNFDIFLQNEMIAFCLIFLNLKGNIIL